MDYTITQKKTYAQAPDAVYKAALGAVAGLEGEVLQEDAAAGTIQAKFDKRIHGQTLGDRTQIEIAVTADGDAGSAISVDLYPIDPVGRKLMFGARKGVTQKVMEWFFAHLEHRLS
jgi:hypothetical protein